MESLKAYIPSQFQELAAKSVTKLLSYTFKSDSKIVRILSCTSSLFTGWTIARWIYLKTRSKLFNYPPFHFAGVPILGSMIYFTEFATLDMKFGGCGPIIMTSVGKHDYIFLNDINLIKHQSNVYKELIYRNTINLWSDSVNQFFLSNHNWHQRRKIASAAFLSQLRSKHLNKGYMNILTNQIFPKLDKLNNEIYTTMKDDLLYLVFAMIFSTSFGHTMDVPLQNSDIIKAFFTANTNQSLALRTVFVNELILGPTISNFLHHKIFSVLHPFVVLDQIVSDWIKNYELNQNENTDSNRYYIQDMLEHVKNGKLSKKEMIRDTLSVFVAGMDTTTSALLSGFYTLIKCQDIQQRLYDELLGYKQKYGVFSLDHIHENELNVLRAFVFETLRNFEPVPHSFPRYVTNDNVELNGYNIPKGCYVIGNHYFVNHSSKYWAKPNEFYIEHFLDENGRFKMNKNFVTFGFGGRDCMGQSLAIKNLNLLFGHFLLRFIFTADNKKDFEHQRIPVVGLGVATIRPRIQRRET